MSEKKYIDAEMVKAEFTGNFREEYPTSLIKAIIDDVPAADVQEVKHGKWVKDKRERRGDGEIYDYCCSLCKSPAAEGSYGNRDVLTPYCSQCGAKMDKETEK